MATLGGMDVDILKGLITVLYTPNKPAERYVAALESLHDWQTTNGLDAEAVINHIRSGIKPPEIYLTFGKYGSKGDSPRTIHQIADEDIQYLTWVYENVERLNPTTAKVIEGLLKQSGLTDVGRPDGSGATPKPTPSIKSSTSSANAVASPKSYPQDDYDDDDIPF
jgi:hypothetical protein